MSSASQVPARHETCRRLAVCAASFFCARLASTGSCSCTVQITGMPAARQRSISRFIAGTIVIRRLVFTPEMPSVPFSCRKPFCMSMTISAALLMSMASSAMSALLLVTAQHASARPGIFWHVLDDHMQVVWLAAGMRHHRVGDGAHELALLLGGPAGPHLDGHDGHDQPPLRSWSS